MVPSDDVYLSTMCNKWAKLASTRPAPQGCLFYRVGEGNSRTGSLIFWGGGGGGGGREGGWGWGS